MFFFKLNNVCRRKLGLARARRKSTSYNCKPKGQKASLKYP